MRLGDNDPIGNHMMMTSFLRLSVALFRATLMFDPSVHVGIPLNNADFLDVANDASGVSLKLKIF